MRLQNQTAIVTGAGRGIGRATALALAREILLAVTQSPKVHTPELPLYTTSSPEIEMIRHWE